MMAQIMNCSLGFLCLVLTIGCVSCHKILMSALLGEGSHFLCAASIGESLVESGHDVTFLISNAYAHRASDPKFSELFHFEIFRHPISVEEVHKQFDLFNSRAFLPASSQMWTLTEVMRDGRAADCDALLGDVDIMDRLVRANYSAVVYDIGWVCPIIIARWLQIPHIAVSAVSTPCTITEPAGSYATPAFVPEIFSGFSNEMNFKERVKNSLAYVLIRLFGIYFRLPYERLRKKYNIEPSEASLDKLYARSELFLINSDFSVEYPCAVPPNVIPVGGLTTRPSDPLPEDLEKFMQSAGKDGVIVCTMGTYFTSVPIHLIKDFVNAFGRLPQKVIFQLRKVPPEITLPANVITLPWLPQNDLLGHNQTRAFMYQGGNNGFYEALYHAVPIVVVPIHGDQYDTGAKVTSHQIGISIDKMTLSESRIHDALREVTSNASYARNMKHFSDMFRDRPMTPAAKAAFWIDHVLTYGGSSYRLHFVNQSFIERNLVDVFCFFVLFIVIFIFVIWIIFRILIKLVSRILQVLGLVVSKEKKE